MMFITWMVNTIFQNIKQSRKAVKKLNKACILRPLFINNDEDVKELAFCDFVRMYYILIQSVSHIPLNAFHNLLYQCPLNFLNTHSIISFFGVTSAR